MSKKTLKFDNVEANKEEFHASKQPIVFRLFSKCKSNINLNSDTGFKCFIGYKDDNIFRPLWIILPQMSGYIKYFNNGGKNMSLMIEDDSVLVKYSNVWNKIKEIKGIKVS